ncbi:MAG TPA: VWA domain-containing protein [Pyrinomonadaceae bacterium]|nr:VWA domain-containing protein [Pyrinomonadaceae bacterium]
MKPLISILLAFGVAAAAPPGRPRTTVPQGQQDEEVVAVGSNEVLLDAVVRDKKGRPVRDLTASDFEVYEDGVLQRLSSFRLVTKGADAAAAPSGPAGGEATPATGRAAVRAAPGGAGGPSFSAVAIVFDRLSPDARAPAPEAALSYLAAEGRADEFVGVFAIDQSLRVLQAFTNDRRLARRAVEASASQSSSAFASNAEKARELSQRQANLDAQIAGGQAAAGPGSAGASASTLGGDIADQKMAEMTERTLETFERLERDQQGYATAYGLLAVINSLRELAGRKALVFFSEGLAIPPAVQGQFRAVVGNANRANVSIYAVDAAGLRAESPNAEARREIESLGARRIRQTASGVADTSGQPMSRVLERNEDLLRMNPQSGLGELADSTGGLLVSGTNDPGARLRQVDEDLHTYYALTYAPTNAEFDGRFRHVTLKLKRPGLDVQTRRGYYAINPSISSPVLPYEAPALGLLSGAPRGEGFPLRAAGFNFPEPGRAGLVAVVVEVPEGAVTFATDQAKKTYQTDFSVVVLLKDRSQRVVRKLSNQYRLSGPAGEMEAARRRQILFYREADLAPGRYTLAVAAYDALSGKGGTVADGLEVVGPGQGLRLSSLAIVKRVERLSEAEQKRPHPFHFSEALIYPSVGEPLRKSVEKQLPFFLTVYTAADAKAAPKLTVEILQSGRPIGRAALELPLPDAEGRIKYASSLPLDKLRPGDYELRVTADDGAARASRAAAFTVVN